MIFFTKNNKLGKVQVLNLSPIQHYLALCYSSASG